MNDILINDQTRAAIRIKSLQNKYSDDEIGAILRNEFPELSDTDLEHAFTNANKMELIKD